MAQALTTSPASSMCSAPTRLRCALCLWSRRPPRRGWCERKTYIEVSFGATVWRYTHTSSSVHTSSGAPLRQSAERLALALGAGVLWLLSGAGGSRHLRCPQQEAGPRLRGFPGGQYPHICYESLPACPWALWFYWQTARGLTPAAGHVFASCMCDYWQILSRDPFYGPSCSSQGIA